MLQAVLIFGLMPFHSELSGLAQKAVSCLNAVCAATVPGDLRDAPADVPTRRAAVAAVGFVPGRAFLVLPPPSK